MEIAPPLICCGDKVHWRLLHLGLQSDHLAFEMQREPRVGELIVTECSLFVLELHLSDEIFDILLIDSRSLYRQLLPYVAMLHNGMNHLAKTTGRASPTVELQPSLFDTIHVVEDL